MPGYGQGYADIEGEESDQREKEEKRRAAVTAARQPKMDKSMAAARMSWVCSIVRGKSVATAPDRMSQAASGDNLLVGVSLIAVAR